MSTTGLGTHRCCDCCCCCCTDGECLQQRWLPQQRDKPWSLHVYHVYQHLRPAEVWCRHAKVLPVHATGHPVLVHWLHFMGVCRRRRRNIIWWTHIVQTTLNVSCAVTCVVVPVPKLDGYCSPCTQRLCLYHKHQRMLTQHAQATGGLVGLTA